VAKVELLHARYELLKLRAKLVDMNERLLEEQMQRIQSSDIVN
jgi:hypothetical protein